ncbi:MAG: hypothetical protein M3Y27_12985 [Acidobacteriota bacterium]|nr:hypothetical protein [Acidobacteriota bacterium]
MNRRQFLLAAPALSVPFALAPESARVNSINLFAKGHHGYAYYNTKIATRQDRSVGRDDAGVQEQGHRDGLLLFPGLGCFAGAKASGLADG